MPDGSVHKPFRLWPVLLFLAIAILLLLCAFIASLPTIVSSDWGKEKLFRYLKSKYHIDVKCQRLSLEWFGHLEVTDLEVIDTEKKLAFTCDIIKTEADLYDLLFKKNFGYLFFDRPDLKISPSLLSFFSGTPYSNPMQRASLFPLGKTPDIYRLSLPYIGIINCSYGKIEVLAEGLEPILFDEIALNLENTPAEHAAYVHLSCLTLQKGVQGKIHADATCTQMNSDSPIIKAQVDLSQLPVEGLDELLSSFQPHYRGLLVQAIGETADASLHAVSAAGNFEIDLSTTSPLFTAKMSMATEDGKVSLKEPAAFTYTVTPAFFQKLSTLAPKTRDLSLKENGTLQITLNQFSSAIPHSLEDLLKASFDAKITESSPFAFACNGATVTVDAMDLHVASSEGSMQYSGQASLMSAQKSAHCHVEGLFHALSHEMSFSATATDVPTALLGQITGFSALPTLVGETLSLLASGEKTLLRLEVQTPLFTLEKTVFSIDDRLTLRSPVALSYQLLPDTLHLLEKGLDITKKALLQGHINNFSLPLYKGLESMQLDLEVTSDPIEIAAQEPLAITNMVAQLSIHTLNQISLVLSSDRLQASFMGKYEEKTGKITLTQPLACTTTVDNALLHAWITTPACLMQPVAFKLAIDPFSFPARAFSMQTLALKGSASIDRLILLPFEGAPEIALNSLSLPFQWDGSQKAATVGATAQVQEKDQPSGSLSFKGTFSDVTWGKWDAVSAIAVLDVQQIPSAFMDSLLGQAIMTPIAGPQFNGTLKMQSTPQQQNMNFSLSSPLLNVKSAFTTNANTLALGPTPAQIQWTLTPEGYKTLDRLLTKQNNPKQNNQLGFELKEPTRFQIALSQLELPLVQQTPASLWTRIPKIRFDLSLLQCVGNAANPSIAIFDAASQETLSVSSLAFSFNKSRNMPLTFACDTAISSQSAGNNTAPSKAGSLSLKGNIEQLFDAKGQMHFDTLSSQIALSIKNFPSRLLDLVARLKGRTDYPFTKVFGNTIQASLQADIKNQSGPVSLNVNSPNVRFSLDSTVSKGALVLNQPIYAQMKITKEMSTLLLNEVNPLSLTYFYSEDPVTLEIPARGFYLPLNPFDLGTLAIPSARIELGKVACRNEGNIQIALGLLKTKQFEKNKELLLWFAPMDLHVSQGTVDVERTEILLAESFDIAIWGKLLLPDNYVDLVLGLTAQTLSKSFGIKNLPEDYVLTIPMKGKADNVQINSSKATAKIALLLAAQQKALQNSMGKSGAGALLGGLLQHMATLPDNGKVPPAKHPFPWEKRTGFEEELEKPREKKLRFKQNEKPLKQLFKVVK